MMFKLNIIIMNDKIDSIIATEIMTC